MTNSKEKNPDDQIEALNTEIVQSNNQLVNDYDIDSFLEKRKEFITKVKAIMVEGKDYHVIQGKQSLAKGGAEKIASIFGWQSEFRKDEDVMGAFKIDGLIAFVCRLSKSGIFVGEGRGAATLQKNGTDPNKTIKMAQKSAFIDSVLRASGLSDFFTQDLEDMNLNGHQTPNPAITDEQSFKVSGSPSGLPATLKQKNFIKVLMKACHIEKLSEAGFEEKEMTVTYAKEIIDKLIKLKDEPKEEELPTINIE